MFLMARDALGAHARDELGISETLKATPLQAALALAASFSPGAAMPLLVTAAGGSSFRHTASCGGGLLGLPGHAWGTCGPRGRRQRPHWSAARTVLGRDRNGRYRGDWRAAWNGRLAELRSDFSDLVSACVVSDPGHTPGIHGHNIMARLPADTIRSWQKAGDE
jgi:hypothetical protein